MRKSIFLVLLSPFLRLQLSIAEPLPPLNLDEACASESIVLAEYLSYRPQTLMGKIEYFTPPLAQFRLIKTLYASPTPEFFLTRYDFHDGSACLEEKGWKFSSSLLPKKGTKIVLFISKIPKTPGWYQSYRGDWGRKLPGSEVDSIISYCREKNTK